MQVKHKVFNPTHSNNFDFLRLLFATMVIITHSFTLSGKTECDWLCILTNGQTNFSYIGVRGFFVISGFLIFQSLLRSKNLADYFWKRILRIYPGLFIVLILTVILGYFVYESSNTSYFSNRSVLSYIPRNLSLFNLQYSINGIFSDLPFKKAINGSLWTLSYEFTMYSILATLIFINKSLIRLIILISCFTILVVLNLGFIEFLHNNSFILNFLHLADLGAFFIGGSILAAIDIKNNKVTNSILSVSVLILIVTATAGYFYIFKYLIIAIIIFFGIAKHPFISDINKSIGDLSYGVYIYAFPIQQTLMYFFKLDYLKLMCFSIIISYIFGYISWHFIEKPALKLKGARPSDRFMKLLKSQAKE